MTSTLESRTLQPPGGEDRVEFGAQDLERDFSVVAHVVREVDGGHGAGAELALDAVAVGEGGRRGRSARAVGEGGRRGRSARAVESRCGSPITDASEAGREAGRTYEAEAGRASARSRPT